MDEWRWAAGPSLLPLFPPTEWPSWAGSHWAQPAPSFPTAPWAPSTSSNGLSAGLLGPRPAQSYHTGTNASMNYIPMDIDHAMNTLSLSTPDEQFYMDTSPTSHMTRSQGTLFPYCPVKHQFNNAIVVGNGNLIPVLGHGHISFPSSQKSLSLKNVLHAPKLIKNLISVRKFTHDNMVSVEFDPFGFSVKDLATGSIVLRSNSTGDLYPFPSAHGATPSSSISSAFSVFSSSIWHSRLGHPGNAVLNSLYSSSLIKCNKDPHFVCHSCPLGKHIQLPFVNSMAMSSKPFDIIHSDLWTSPISSPSGYKYYVLFLDNYTNFLWTFPLYRKSQVYDVFVNFHTFINTQFELNIKSFQYDNGVNLRIICFVNFALVEAFHFVFLVLTHHPKMANPNEKFDP